MYFLMGAFLSVLSADGELIAFPCQVSEVVINQAEEIPTAGGEVEIRFPKSSALFPSLRRKHDVDHTLYVLCVVFPKSRFSDRQACKI